MGQSAIQRVLYVLHISHHFLILFGCVDMNKLQVNISGECRERILATDVTAYDIFDEARTEVLAVMEVSRCFWLLGFSNIDFPMLAKFG